MSIDVQSGPPPGALQEAPVTAVDDLDLDPPWSETAITVIGAIVTVGFVSFVAMLMALA